MDSPSKLKEAWNTQQIILGIELLLIQALVLEQLEGGCYHPAQGKMWREWGERRHAETVDRVANKMEV